MSTYSERDIIDVKVTGIEDYGIFVVSLEGDKALGLIHISEISDSFVRNILDYVSVGEKIKVRVMSYDTESNKLKLSIKNINYRDDDISSFKIKENGNGFLSLKIMLPKWISNKLSEIDT